MKININRLAFNLALFASLLISSSNAFCDKRSKLEVAETSYSFGQVYEGDKVSHDFIFKNTGDAKLQIQRVAPSCGCTVATLENDGAVEPGQSAKVHVEFDTSGFSGDKTKTVQVFTSDLDDPQVTLVLKGAVMPGATIEPTRLEFGEINPGMDQSAWSKEFTLNLSGGGGTKVSAVKSLSQYVGVSSIGGNRYKVTLDPSISRGTLRERILVELSGTKPRTLNLPLVGFVRGDIRAEPSTLSFGVIEGERPLERRIKLENSGKEPIKVLSVNSNSPAINTQIKEVQPGKSFVIIVDLDPKKVSREIRASVDIETDHSEEKLVSVNVFGVTPPKS